MTANTNCNDVHVNGSETLFRGRVFSLAVDDITLPNGVRTQIAFVRHPGSTGIVPVDEDGLVVMTRQYRHPVNEYLLEIPAGTTDPGENPLECARRELEEETGLVAGELIEIANIHILPAYSDERVHIYLARKFTQTCQKLDPDEIINIERYAMEDLMQMIDAGEITDALTILAIQHARRYLRRNRV